VPHPSAWWAEERIRRAGAVSVSFMFAASKYGDEVLMGKKV
jgi:hypothetical protein